MSTRASSGPVTTDSNSAFARARKVADAVLYEGYVLYPYRASAGKNQIRWQFGVVAPRPFSEVDSSENWWMQTECLVETTANAMVDIKLRFLQVQRRTVEEVVEPEGSEPGSLESGRTYRPVESLEVGDQLWVTWEEAIEHEIDIPELALGEAWDGEREVPIELLGSREVELLRSDSGGVVGRLVRERWAISGLLRVAAEPVEGPYPLVKLRCRIENLTPWGEAGLPRSEVMRRSLVAMHTLFAVRQAKFISLIDPPEFARPAAGSCENVRTWPVLIGDEGSRQAMLSSPIILYDYPEVAPESEGDFCDATEIDEMLVLRVMTLTEEEKREARSTDARAAEIIDRSDTIPDEIFERLHGVVRYLRRSGSHGDVPVAGTSEPAGFEGFEKFGSDMGEIDDTGGSPRSNLPPDPTDPENSLRELPWWDPSVDAQFNPWEDTVWIGSVEVGKGARVKLRPGGRRSDAHDLFLIGRIATVEGVFSDVDGDNYLAVTLEDDPDVDIMQWHGRYLYFRPDEVEPLEAG